MRLLNLHVLHVITAIGRGGAENHLLELVRHQRASGMTVSVAYLRGTGYWRPGLENLGVEVHHLGLGFYGDLKPLRRLRRLIKGTRIDLIHAHLPPAELYCRLALFGTGRSALPLLITKHNEERFCNAPGHRALGRWVARRADRVIAISEAVKRYMAGSGLGMPAGKIETIYYGIHASAFAPDGGKTPRPELTIGFVGRLVPQKDIATLLRGFALFADGSVKARLVIVGEGSLMGELRQLADELGIASLVEWAGFREDIAAVMAGFDIFALTSLYEGLGLVLLEAMAAGVAVAATRVGAIPEVVVDGETGLLVEAGKPAKLAAAFQKLSDSAVRCRMGEAGRRRVNERFTLQEMWDATDALYSRCALANSTDNTEPMLVFIVPLKSAKISRSWSLSNRLFERCIRSICRQTSDTFRVVVVCNERPEIPFSHPHVHYIEVDFPPPFPEADEEQTGGYEYGYSRDIARKNADKARKIHTGLEYAARYQPTHSMVVDADDCVSSRLADFVSRNPRSDGWFFKKGYLYPEGGRFLYFNVRNFYQICGSSVIIAYGLTQALFSNPEFYEHTFDEPPPGVALAPLPFPGAVYSMENGDNIYMSSETRQSINGTLLKRIFSRNIFALARKVMKYRPAFLTGSIRSEFGIYDIGHPPAFVTPVDTLSPSAEPQPE